MKKILPPIEICFSIFTLLFATGPLISLFRVITEGAILYDGDPLIITTWFGIYLVLFFLIILRWRRFVNVAMSNKLLLLIIGLALISALWSIAPSITLGRTVTLVFTSSFGIYLASRYSFKEQLQLLAWALGIAALLSLIFVIVPPHYGIEAKGTYAGAGRGIYHSKNSLGHVMALSTIVFLFLAFSKTRYRWLSWVAFGLSFGLLLLSTAKGPLVTVITVLVFMHICKALRWHYSLRIPFLIAVVLISGVVGTLLLSNVETALSAMGKDITLTGRTQLWYLLLNSGLQHPWLGYGYYGFWRGWDGPSALVWNSLLWKPSHAHNGILQLWLDLGLVGVVLFALSYIADFLKAVAWVRSTKTIEGFWPIVCLTFMFLSNVTECLILVSHHIWWILYVAATFSMSVQSQSQQKNSYTSATTNKHGLAQDA